jgi:predicted GTPase
VSRWRILIVLVLALAPFVALTSLGGYYLWLRGWSFWAWWPMAVCWIAAYLLVFYWHRSLKLLGRPDVEIPPHWSERDKQAWQIVEARARNLEKLTPEDLGELHSYVDTAQKLALDLARVYHADAADPVGDLTIPELLAVIELAAHDLSELVAQYLPGSHLLTIRNWRQARQAADWYQTLSSAYWFLSALFSPLQTGLRFGASRLGMSVPWQQFQRDLLAWFYAAYVHRLGNYLIELYGGRLRVGADRYRELLRPEESAEPSDFQPAAPADHATVTMTILGQVKAGKSSFLNALLGEQRARVDVVPATSTITRYDLRLAGPETHLQLLDTIGYAHAGPRADQAAETAEAAQQSDLVLLVMHALNPARSADLLMLEALEKWFQARPGVKMPAILGVLTHIDLLSPVMEWAPPYNWLAPERPKEHQIQHALQTVRDQLGQHLVGCVPLCTAAEKIYGIDEWFLPTLMDLLDEAKAVAVLRCLRAESDAGKIRKLWSQIMAAGGHLAGVLWDRSALGKS